MLFDWKSNETMMTMAIYAAENGNLFVKPAVNSEVTSHRGGSQHHVYTSRSTRPRKGGFFRHVPITLWERGHGSSGQIRWFAMSALARPTSCHTN